MPEWTPQQLADVARMTNAEFHQAYPGVHSSAAVHIKRRRLRDSGVNVRPEQIGRPPDPIEVTLPELPPEPADEEVWQAYETMRDIQRRHDEAWSTRDAAIQIRTDRPVGIVFMSDFHLGGKGVDTTRLREDVALIQSCDRLRVVIGGDGIDNFIVPALSHVHRNESLVTLDVQMLLFRSIVKQLLPQLLCVGSGNHDGWSKKMAGIDANLAMLRDIPVLHTREDTYLDLTVGNQTYTIYRKHRPAKTSQWNAGQGVQHAFRFGERPFDIGVTEHIHTPHISSFIAHQRLRWAVCTGSYKVDDSHAREFGFVNGGIGTPVIVLDPHRHEIIPFMEISQAVSHLEGG